VRILVIDIGGSHVKLVVGAQRTPLKLLSGPDMTPRQMMKAVLEATADWKYDHVSIGYPGPVRNDRPTANPVNLGPGWVGFDFHKAFRKPVRVVNDAAMQALGSYDGGRMLFMGLGTGLGTALVTDGVVVPLEISHLPYHDGETYEDFLGEAGMKLLGKRRWKKHVQKVAEMFRVAFNADYVVLGGGNVRHIAEMPPHTRRGSNANAFRGGLRLWKKGTTLP
jgi:polyphosphate glucokinase